jgi:hypothetical protein
VWGTEVRDMCAKGSSRVLLPKPWLLVKTQDSDGQYREGAARCSVLDLSSIYELLAIVKSAWFLQSLISPLQLE